MKNNTLTTRLFRYLQLLTRSSAHFLRAVCLSLFSFAFVALFSAGYTQLATTDIIIELKKPPVENLVKSKATPASGMSEKLPHAASVVQIVTVEKARNRGATNVADALVVYAKIIYRS